MDLDRHPGRQLTCLLQTDPSPAAFNLCAPARAGGSNSFLSRLRVGWESVQTDLVHPELATEQTAVETGASFIVSTIGFKSPK